MNRKIALFAFRGEAICFVHVLLNALDMKERGHDVTVVLEGPATKAAVDLAIEGTPFHDLYVQAREAGLFDCACKACSAKMGALEGLEKQGIVLDGAMSGHPAMSRFIDEGYEIINF